MNNDNQHNINVAVNELTKVICEALGALSDDDWREALEMALVQAEQVRIEHNAGSKGTHFVTVSPETKARLISEHGLSEADFEANDEGGE